MQANPTLQVGSSETNRTTPSPTPAAPATGNLLDFRSQEDVASYRASPSSSQTNLAATIQPQRRGRPTKTPGANVPNTNRQPVADKPVSAQPVPSFRIQVTGDGQQETAAKPNLASDIKRFAADFGDSFTPEAGLITPAADANKDSQLGFDDGFDGKASRAIPTPEPLTSARTTSPISTNIQGFSGFGDSFAPPKLGNVGRQTSSKTISLPVPSEMKSSSPALSPSSEHSSAFEDRYPSVEQLAARQESGSDGLLVKSPETMSKPLRPSFGRQGSSEVNSRGLSFHQPSITGGAADDNQKMRLLSIDEAPHARSTHVTGTAFTSSEGKSPVRNTQPSFDLLDSINTDLDSSSRPSASALPQNAEVRPDTGFQELTDSEPSKSTDVGRLGAPATEKEPLISSPTTMESSTGRQGSLPRDLLTGGNNGSFDDHNYAALLPSGRATGKKPPPVNAKPARFGNQVSGAPLSAGSPVAPGGQGVSASSSMAAPSESSKAPKPRPLPSKPDHLRRPPASPSRSGSPRLPPSSYSPVSPGRVSSPPSTARSGNGNANANGPGSAPGEYPSRPAVVSRRSSINEMVAKYESLSSPRLENEGFDPSSVPRARGQTIPKPAPKPVQLKVGSQGQGQGVGVEQDTGSGLNRSRSMFLPADAPRRRLTPEMDRPYARSGRPITTTGDAGAGQSDPGMDGGGNNKGVNALIARWNQGTVPAQGTHPSVAKARAPLGSGRRL